MRYAMQRGGGGRRESTPEGFPHMKTRSLPRFAVAATLCIGAFIAAPASAEAINGAIYTSTIDGTTVNANLYDSKDAVYLNGGPANAPGCNGGDGELGKSGTML